MTRISVLAALVLAANSLAGCSTLPPKHSINKAIIDGSLRGECVECVKAAVKRDGDMLDALGPSGGTPLHLAATYRAHETMRVLLRAGADPNVRADSSVFRGEMPLHYASRMRGNRRAVAALIDAGAEIDAVSAAGDTPLSVAARDGNAEIVAQLISAGADPNHLNAERESAIMLAVRSGSLETVNALVAAGADPRAPGLLNRAAGHGGPGLVGALIAAGAPMGVPVDDTGLPLHWVAAVGMGGNPDNARLLIEAGANPNARRADGETPLTLAAQVPLTFTRPLMEILLEAGANPDAAVPGGRTALHMLAAKPDDGSAAAARVLLDAGASVDAETDSGATPLMMAAKRARRYRTESIEQRVLNGTRALIDQLLAEGADINHRTPDGVTPLIHAARDGNRPIVAHLIVRGADLDLGTNAGETALHVAADRGDLDLATLLVEAGANALIPNARGRTADGIIMASIEQERQKAVARAELAERRRANRAERERQKAEDRAFVVGAIAAVGAAAGAAAAGVDTNSGAAAAANIGMAARNASLGDTAGAAANLGAARSALERGLAAQRAAAARPATVTPNRSRLAQPAARRDVADGDGTDLCTVQAGWGDMKSPACKELDRRNAAAGTSGTPAASDGGVNAEGYRHFEYKFSCGGPDHMAHQTVKVPYKSEAGLALTKRYARAAVCDPEEAERIATQCRAMDRPHCIER